MMLVITPTDLPGNSHQTDDDSPTKVVRSDSYRLSWADVLKPGDGWFAGLMNVFPEVHRPDDVIGLAGLESQEHSILWLGPAEVIDLFAAAPDHGVPWDAFSREGLLADRWPNTDAWQAYLPPTTWNPGGQGIVTEHAFPDGAKVVVYELLGSPALLSAGVKEVSHAEPVPVVTYHCTRCHQAADQSDRYSSASPEDRRAASRRARKHMRPGNCRGAAATVWGDKMTAAVAEAVTGTSIGDPAGLYAARCQTAQIRTDGHSSTTCAEVREARKFSASHRSG
jgi:hypothetical protein